MVLSPGAMTFIRTSPGRRSTTFFVISSSLAGYYHLIIIIIRALRLDDRLGADIVFRLQFEESDGLDCLDSNEAGDHMLAGLTRFAASIHPVAAGAIVIGGFIRFSAVGKTCDCHGIIL